MKIDTAGTYTLRYSAMDQCGNVATKDRVLTVAPPPIYGVRWDGAVAAMERTDLASGFSDPNPAVANGNGSSPFDEIMPWSGMEIVEDDSAGTLVSIPKYWYKWARRGVEMRLQISNVPQDGFSVSPAHADRGDGVGERDVVYVGRYRCSESNFKSVSGVLPKGNYKINEFRTSIHNLGEDIWQYDFAMFWTIAMLYLVEYANWDSQKKIGYGCGSVQGTKQREGTTDQMIYHTGTNAVNRETYGDVQYRHIEGMWSNVYTFCDGIYFNGAEIYCEKNPAFFGASGGTLVGERATTESGLVESFTNPSIPTYEYALYPSVISPGTNYDTLVTDGYGYSASGVSLLTGGKYNSLAKTYGLFYFTSAGDFGLPMIGSRLMKLPND